MAHRYLASLGFNEDPSDASRSQTPFDPNEDLTYVPPTPMPTNVNMPNVDIQIWELLQRLETKLDNVMEQVALLRTEVGEIDTRASRLEGQVQNLRQNTHTSFQNLASTINPLSATVTMIHNSMQGGIWVGPVQAPPQVATAQPGPAVVAPVPVVQAGGMKLAKPEKFDSSKKDKAINFKLACSSFINVNYAHHPDANKIVFIMSYLEGAAHDWLRPFLEEQMNGNTPLALQSLPEFWAEFDKRFGDVNWVESYRLKLRVLKQSKSVQDYLREFQTYSAPLGYGDLARRDMFYDGLHSDIKEVMLVRGFRHADPQNSFADIANLAMEIDISLESFKPHRYSKSTTPQVTTKITSLGGESTRAPTTTPGRQEKYSKGDAVYMIGSDGRAVKGKITNIGRNACGIVQPTVKWNNTLQEVQVPFNVIKRDTRPSNNPVSSPPVVAPKPNPKGPGPMEVDQAGKGKNMSTCNKCGGRGHFARECPSQSYSGHEAHLSDAEEEDTEKESEKGDA